MPFQKLIGAAGFAAANCRILLIVALPFVLPAGGGTLTPQEATSAYKAENKLTISVLKVQLSGAKSSILGDIAAFENGVKQGGDVHALAAQFFNDCVAFQVLTRSLITNAIDDVMSVGFDLLELVGGGVPLNGVYPKDFYSGNGGLVDDARDDIKKEVDKLYGALRKRLSKTRGVLESNGAALTVVLRPPLVSYDFNISDGVSSIPIPSIGLDTVVSINRTNIAEDGRVRVGGYAAGSVASVVVNVSGSEAQQETVVPAAGRWQALVDDAGTFFTRGNYIVSIHGEVDEAFFTEGFSFR